VTQGFGHEAEFDPLATLFEVLENFELVHFSPRFGPKRKGAAHGPRLIFAEFLLYTFSIAVSDG
jgi:hypothetical protein